MSQLIINGTPVPTPGLRTQTWLENPKLRLAAEDRKPRPPGTWIRGIVLHTTTGFPKDPGDPPQLLKVGLGPNTRAAERINTIVWEKDHRCAGSHLMIDSDGRVDQLADLASEVAFHAGPVNDVTIGIEIYADPKDNALYEEQIVAVVETVDFLTRHFKIQRQMPSTYRGVVDRLAAGGRGVVGVYGHRHVSDTRGAGDPGDFVFDELARAGYERFDFYMAEERTAWMMRQQKLVPAPDGVPGPQTVAALQAQGRHHGLWVARPSD